MHREPTEMSVRTLVDGAFAMRHRNPAAARRLAAAAVRLAERRSEADPEGADLQALAWAHYGNILRVCNDLGEAETAMDRAIELLRRGSGCSKLRARIIELQASLMEALGRFADGAKILVEALRLRRSQGDDQALVAGLVQLANLVGHGGRPATAVRILSKALSLLKRGVDPRLDYAVLHNMAWFLMEAGLPQVAHEITLEQQHSGMLAPDPLLALRRRWLLARIAAGLGATGVAVHELAAVRDEFTDRGCLYDAAFAALGLALVYAECQAWECVEPVLAGVGTIFANLGITREATASRLLAEAAQELTAAKRTVPRVVAALRLDRAERARGTARVS